jgi:DNA-binding PadR family transcriptional regulator
MNSLTLTTTIKMVLRDLLSNSESWGSIICDRTGLGHGTVYEIILRLKRVGAITISIEEKTPGLQRKRRNIITMTEEGLAWAKKVTTCLEYGPTEIEREACARLVEDMGVRVKNREKEGETPWTKTLCEERIAACHTAALLIRLRSRA